MNSWSFFIIFVFHFLPLKNCQCNVTVDIISTLPNELLAEIVKQVETSLTDNRGDFLSRANLSATSKKFNNVVKVCDRQFYHLRELEEFNLLEQEAWQFMIIFDNLINCLKGWCQSSNNISYFIIQFIKDRNPSFDLGGWVPKEIFLNTSIVSFKEHFKKRPSCFPEAISDLEANRCTAEKLMAQRKRGLNLFQNEVKEFLKGIIEHMNCLGNFKKNYEEETIKIYLLTKAFEDTPAYYRSDPDYIQILILAMQPLIETQIWEVKWGAGLFAVLNDLN